MVKSRSITNAFGAEAFGAPCVKLGAACGNLLRLAELPSACAVTVERIAVIAGWIAELIEALFADDESVANKMGAPFVRWGC
jgi:hypothetical protein